MTWAIFFEIFWRHALLALPLVTITWLLAWRWPWAGLALAVVQVAWAILLWGSRLDPIHPPQPPWVPYFDETLPLAAWAAAVAALCGAGVGFARQRRRAHQVPA